MIASLRLTSQQLADPQFDSPKDLVNWMGAIQAQDPAMARWAVGIRLKSATEETVRNALDRGEILRTHIMRPTWHLVSAEDIRWMLKLTGQRVRAANYSFGKTMGVPESLYAPGNRLFEKILQGGNHLTKEEIVRELTKAGITDDAHVATRLLADAEMQGIICSGACKGEKITYALLEERVPPVKELHQEEALALFAEKYFQSHSPASEEDFRWWSGLSATEARHAIGLISHRLEKETSGSRTFYLHASLTGKTARKDILHLLPSFDEFLISYKDRSDTLAQEHRAKAFNNYGTFYPVILHNGRIVGNWKKLPNKKQPDIQATFFEPDTRISNKLTEQASIRYKTFLKKL